MSNFCTYIYTIHTLVEFHSTKIKWNNRLHWIGLICWTKHLRGLFMHLQKLKKAVFFRKNNQSKKRRTLLLKFWQLLYSYLKYSLIFEKWVLWRHRLDMMQSRTFIFFPCLLIKKYCDSPMVNKMRNSVLEFDSKVPIWSNWFRLTVIHDVRTTNQTDFRFVSICMEETDALCYS